MEIKTSNIKSYFLTVPYDEKAFEMVGPHAPQKVKDAWMEAAKEVNVNGTGIKKNGMMSHISQMMVQGNQAWRNPRLSGCFVLK